MSVQVEKLEKNMAKLTIEVPADEVEKALQSAFLKNKNRINVPGFRKGKVPRQMIEKMYGPEIFYEDAVKCDDPTILGIDGNDTDTYIGQIGHFMAASGFFSAAGKRSSAAFEKGYQKCPYGLRHAGALPPLPMQGPSSPSLFPRPSGSPARTHRRSPPP